MNTDEKKELENFSQKLNAERMTRKQKSNLEIQIGEKVYKDLYRKVILAVTPLVEETKERLNVAVLYFDLKVNPDVYTDEEKEFITASFEAWRDTQRDFYKQKESVDNGRK